MSFVFTVFTVFFVILFVIHIFQVLEEVMRSEASEKQLIERERNEISAETSTIQIQAKRDLYELQKK